MTQVYTFDRALVRSPSPSVVDGLRAVDEGPPDFSGVLGEHEAYVRALEQAGVAVERLPPLADFPDAVFVEDVALAFTGVAIALRPGHPTRAGEAGHLLPDLERLFPRVLRLDEGSVDGGDVLITPDRVLIGRSARTSAAGADALVALLAQIGRRATPVATPAGVLHLKSDCALLDDETVLATRRLASSGAFDGLRVTEVPDGEERAANVVRVNDRVLMRDDCPRTAEVLDRAGLALVLLPTREISKIDAGLSCMSVRWRAGGAG